jgi:hypothetical protein
MLTHVHPWPEPQFNVDPGLRAIGVRLRHRILIGRSSRGREPTAFTRVGSGRGSNCPALVGAMPCRRSSHPTFENAASWQQRQFQLHENAPMSSRLDAGGIGLLLRGGITIIRKDARTENVGDHRP